MMDNLDITLFENDLPSGLDLGDEIAVDSEAMGLNIHNDRLCLVQIANSAGKCFLIKIDSPVKPAPNLTEILRSQKLTKIFHFARFDVALLNKTFAVQVNNIFCTKIASKLARTFSSKHGLKDLCRDLLDVELLKQEQTSDWGADKLTRKQLKYAASDVLYLHQLKAKLLKMLIREDRDKLAYDCFKSLSTISELDILNINPDALFSH
ncbi:MAG: ribonuclease D [Holosporales bacterium]|jgi:ribonuclease D|nr:ribonuclease D [Holosporales bacterium]